jgi:hypothetical protein
MARKLLPGSSQTEPTAMCAIPEGATTQHTPKRPCCCAELFWGNPCPLLPAGIDQRAGVECLPVDGQCVDEGLGVGLVLSAGCLFIRSSTGPQFQDSGRMAYRSGTFTRRDADWRSPGTSCVVLAPHSSEFFALCGEGRVALTSRICTAVMTSWTRLLTIREGVLEGFDRAPANPIWERIWEQNSAEPPEIGATERHAPHPTPPLTCVNET